MTWPAVGSSIRKSCAKVAQQAHGRELGRTDRKSANAQGKVNQGGMRFPLDDCKVLG